ncbi:DUF4320 family protein [Marasmitruncus massiliensis]|uniref:DUF4320 family protein n=1 Tax=Marasmitruncus massiliensis TaxID=1944642 RepID=UPI000C7CF162|nr:DUF4320 family protein [Marasmitruncus massiliensis]
MWAFKRVRAKLKSRCGMSQYLEFMIALMMLLTLIATGIETWGVLSLKKGIEDTATETARYIELRGAVDSAVYDEFNRLRSVTGIDGELSVEGDFYSGKKLQLEAPFTVTVSAVGHLFYLDVPLKAKATGRSEVYHK